MAAPAQFNSVNSRSMAGGCFDSIRDPALQVDGSCSSHQLTATVPQASNWESESTSPQSLAAESESTVAMTFPNYCARALLSTKISQILIAIAE
jgi:hypothetical protein